MGEIFVNALDAGVPSRPCRDSEERLSLAAASAEAEGLGHLHDTGSLWATDKLREILHFALDEDLTFERFWKSFTRTIAIAPGKPSPIVSRRESWSRLEYRIVLPDGRVRWIVSRGRSFPALPRGRNA